MTPHFVSLEEAAKVLGIGRSTAYAMAKRGEFPVAVVRVGSKLKVSSYRLDQLLGVEDEARAS